ncbi:sensor histidine kinase [Chryseolinea lacunae]|uniref:histidine kinase n=1 Tax=Chryseolinea lacunae TaxID=2801331 RepID=A0ABS1KSN8_9BACT|nr:HAMP domain-containing sensor histidine kinase [Chryseolinea lacunae]MBL0742242.1 HAMP domain-containing histidine kinase [Chryseolinea lacunae]
MELKKRVRDLIIGEDKYIESYGEFKQAMLSGQFALIGMCMCLLYLVFDLAAGAYETTPIFLTTIFFLAISIVIHRQGDHCLANYFLLPTINITVYIFAASESPNTGAFIFFIVNAIAAFAVFNYKQRLLSILFAVFTYFLFVMAYFVDFSILPHRNYDADTLLFFVVVNFTLALPGGMMAVYLLISLNHHNAMQLVENNTLLTKTNTELDRFVYSTSHDLRAPLTSVMGLINITERTENVNDMRRYLGMMKDRIHSLDRFIKDITDYSRNNRLEIRKEKVKLVDLAQEVWESLKFSPEAENINFLIEIPEDVFIESDKSRLQVIISNLISNAVRYHDARKPQQFIRLKYQVNGHVFYIKVEDNGQGISPEYHTKIFDMFYRANEQSKGSGLGLYIVKEALVKLSGSIKLESAPGLGTTFTVRLPR